jgi:hypothetical protein
LVADLAGEFVGSGIGVHAHNQNQKSIQDGNISNTSVLSRSLPEEITYWYRPSRYLPLSISSNSINEFNVLQSEIHAAKMRKSLVWISHRVRQVSLELNAAPCGTCALARAIFLLAAMAKPAQARVPVLQENQPGSYLPRRFRNWDNALSRTALRVR